MSSIHQVAEANEEERIAPVEAQAGWLRVVVFVAVALAGIVVVWAIFKGADRDLRNYTALVLQMMPVSSTS